MSKKYTNLTLKNIGPELTAKAQTFLVDLDKDGIATDIVLSYDQKTFIRKDLKAGSFIRKSPLFFVLFSRLEN